MLFDTSFLAPFVLPEATSDQITAFVRRLPAEEFAVSHWTRVELSSLHRSGSAHGQPGRPSGRAGDARFEAMVDESLSILLPTADDFGLAK